MAGVEDGLRKCAALATEGVRSIAVDGWAVDYVRMGAEGEALGESFCYRDERTMAAERALHERISPERMRAMTGVERLRINTVGRDRGAIGAGGCARPQVGYCQPPPRAV